jgi:hypothetical protein
VRTVTFVAAGEATASVTCAAGERATGGGATTGTPTGDVAESTPAVNGAVATAGATPNGWRARATGTNGETLTVFAVCAAP